EDTPMTVRVGINGFGRIGRSCLRAVLQGGADVEVVAVNDITDTETLASLLELDSVSGRLEGVKVDGDVLLVGDARVRVTSVREPGEIPWAEEGVDVVIES